MYGKWAGWKLDGLVFFFFFLMPKCPVIIAFDYKVVVERSGGKYRCVDGFFFLLLRFWSLNRSTSACLYRKRSTFLSENVVNAHILTLRLVPPTVILS